MKKKVCAATLLIIAVIIAGTINAQKKVVPVNQSPLTGITLPTGSKQDSRFLTEVSGKALLEMESKKANALIKRIEIFSLPGVAKSGFNTDSLLAQFSSLGWSVTPVQGDDKFAWLQKDNRYIMAYFSMDKNATDLYFGETAETPSVVFNTNNIQVTQNTDVQKPTQTLTQQTTVQQTNNNNTAIQQPNTLQPVINDGYAYTTTNFNDGWTSTIYDDYVLTTKGAIKVYLSYIEKFNESDYSGTGREKRHYYWDNYVSKYFTTGDKKFDRGGALSDFSADFIEGWASDKQSGEKRYIGMILNIIAFTGRLSVIIASAPDELQFRKQFPKADTKFDNDLLPMYGYNKFAVGKNDLTGTWSSSGGGTMSWYSTTTGEYAGATGAATSDVFNFNADGSYTSEHKGGYGVVGAMNTYQQKYKGNFTVTDWAVTATNRWDKKTTKFDAWFEVVKGGRLLHMVEGTMDTKLFKEK